MLAQVVSAGLPGFWGDVFLRTQVKIYSGQKIWHFIDIQAKILSLISMEACVCHRIQMSFYVTIHNYFFHIIEQNKSVINMQ